MNLSAQKIIRPLYLIALTMLFPASPLLADETPDSADVETRPLDNNNAPGEAIDFDGKPLNARRRTLAMTAPQPVSISPARTLSRPDLRMRTRYRSRKQSLWPKANKPACACSAQT